MSLQSLSVLETYAKHKFPPGYPVQDHVTLYAPDDNVHGALTALIYAVQHSLILAMYGFDDDEVTEAILHQMDVDHVYVQLSLDSTQAAGKHEKTLLEKARFDSNSLAIGRSSHGAIMHLKTFVLDGLDVIGGSANLSHSGEALQDNEFTVTRHPVYAAVTRTKLDLVHSTMLTQMEKKARES